MENLSKFRKCVIKVMDQEGNFYDNAYIENTHDAMMVARFYRDTLGYVVQVWRSGKDITSTVLSAKIIAILPEV